MQLTVMSYNIHKGIGGVDRRYHPERIVEVASHYQPDVLLLQEVDDGVPRSRRDRQIDWLGDRLKLTHRLFQPNVRLREGCYGNAILSRHPLHDAEDVDLTFPPKKRRRAQIARLQLTGVHPDDSGRTLHRTLVIVNLHLGLSGLERKWQLNKLLRSSTLQHIRTSTPLVVAGDFNDFWQNLGSRLLRHNALQNALGRIRTFPAAYPMRSLDGIYFRGDLQLRRSFAGHVQLARQASDHLPVLAEFVLPFVGGPRQD